MPGVVARRTWGPARRAESRLSRPGLLARLRRADGAAGHHVLDRHDPLVVLPPILEDLDGRRRALAHHCRDARRWTGGRPARSERVGAADAAARAPEPARLRPVRPRVPATSRPGDAAAHPGRRQAGPRRRGRREPGLGLQLERRQIPEVAVGHRVLVLLAQELLAQQDIDAGRERVGVLPLVQRHRPRVLPGPEDELGFLLALDRLFPDRNDQGPDDAHDGDAGQQDGHRISGVGPRPPFVLTR